MKKSVRILGDIQKEQAKQYIDELPLDDIHIVKIEPYKETRSTAQNRLMHKWFGEESEQTGDSPDEVKRRYKKKFLIDIFMQREDGEYAKTIQTLRDLWKKGYEADATYLHERVVDMTSTASATVDEMCELLNYIEMDAAQHGIVLTRPESLYLKALGVR